VNQNFNQTSARSSNISNADVNQGLEDITTNSSEVNIKANDLSQLAAQLQKLMDFLNV